jgi:hypothetical protein
MPPYSEGSRTLDNSAEHKDLVQQLEAMHEDAEQQRALRLAALESLAASGVVVIRPIDVQEEIVRISGQVPVVK